MKLRGWGVVAACAVLPLTGCASGDQTPAPASAVTTPAPVDAQEPNKVTYTLRSAEAPTFVDVTLATPDGTVQGAGQRVKPVDFSWWETYEDFDSGFAYVSAQNGTTDESVTCEIWVNNEKVASNTSSGPHSIVTCETSVP